LNETSACGIESFVSWAVEIRPSVRFVSPCDVKIKQWE
jgi:hypothetical protein